MSLGKKINLVLVAVVTFVLVVAFGILISIEASTTKKQVIKNAETAVSIFDEEIETLFKQVSDQQVRLQNTVDTMSAINGVTHVNVMGVDGTHIATTNRALLGAKLNESNLKLVEQIRKEKKSIDVRNDMGSYYELERHIPVHLVSADPTSEVINVIEIEVKTRSKSASDILDAEKILQSIYVSAEQSAHAVIVAHNDGVNAIQKIAVVVANFGKGNGTDQLGFYRDFVVMDSNLNIVTSTSNGAGKFEQDPQKYKQYREDVIAGKKNSASYERIHEGLEVLVRVTQIQLIVGDKIEVVGLTEVHILASAYKDKILTLKLRMLGVGIIIIAVLVIVLSRILKREVVVPIIRYSRVAQKVADGDFNQKIENTSNDEIGNFGEVFNSMVANLRELDKLKSDFITVAAHQLRTPLSGIRWVLKLLIDGDLGPMSDEQNGILKRGYGAAEKMVRLVNDLLNVSRIEDGKSDYKIEKNDFMPLLKNLVDNTKLASEERSIEVRLDNRVGTIAPFFFDPEKLLMALQNIMDNAIRYTLPGGQVTIAIEHKGDYLQITVSDTGVGIPKEDLSKLFTKFFRAANVVNLQTDGSGLGLFIVKSIILRHGGQVWVDSVESQGTTLTVLIPLTAELLPKDGIVAVSPPKTG